MITAEQRARKMIYNTGVVDWETAQSISASDLIEIANLIGKRDETLQTLTRALAICTAELEQARETLTACQKENSRLALARQDAVEKLTEWELIYGRPDRQVVPKGIINR